MVRGDGLFGEVRLSLRGGAAGIQGEGVCAAAVMRWELSQGSVIWRDSMISKDV